MRIDELLETSRLIKRRVVAKEACEGGWVKINDKIVKPGDDAKIDNIIEISLGQGELKCRVVGLEDHVGKNETQSLYESL